MDPSKSASAIESIQNDLKSIRRLKRQCEETADGLYKDAAEIDQMVISLRSTNQLKENDQKISMLVEINKKNYEIINRLMEVNLFMKERVDGRVMEMADMITGHRYGWWR